jgi:hypothetical protein
MIELEFHISPRTELVATPNQRGNGAGQVEHSLRHVWVFR